MSEQQEPQQEPLGGVHSAEQAAAQLPELVAPLPAGATKTERLPRQAAPHALKFRISLAILGVIAIAAIAVTVLTATRHTKHASSAAWSAWSPDTTGSTGVQEIADYVAPFYRSTAAQQLNVITPISLTNQTAAGTTTGSGLTLAVNTGSSSASAAVANDTLSLLSGHSVAYNICGLGARDCELAGTPSTTRLLLLRREALELALYSFKYLSNTQNVLVVLPPGRTVSPSKSGKSSASVASQPITVAVLFVRQELAPWLKVPLDETLAPDPPDVAQLSLWSQTDEAGLVDQITARGLFSSQIQSQQEGGNVLVLSSLPPQ